MKIFQLLKTYKRWGLVLPALFLIGILSVFLSVYAGAYGDLPSAAALRHLPISLPSTLYTEDGAQLDGYYLQEQEVLSFNKIPDPVLISLLASEDHRYYRHAGVDYRSLARVGIKTLLMGKESGGGSTITQQLAKQLYPRKYMSGMGLLGTKIREMIIARRLEKIYSKDTLLTTYLNIAPFSENTAGIAAAARRYYNKPVDKLSRGEAAMLIGLLQAPSAYNPRKNPVGALQRRNQVLEKLARQGFISQSEKETLQKEALNLDYRPMSHHEGMAPYLREHLRGYLNRWCAEHKDSLGRNYNLYTGGLRIYTTLDSRMQRYAEASLFTHMKVLQATFDKAQVLPSPDDPMVLSAVQRLPAYSRWVKQGFASTKIDSLLNVQATRDLYVAGESRLMNLSILDSIRHAVKVLHAGFLAVEPRSGKVRAWVGGIHHRHFQYDHVLSKRQAGSIFKPLVYATALEKGQKPCEYISNEKIEVKDWEPRNANEEYGGDYSMEGALTYSVNLVAVRLIMDIGAEKVVKLARQLGIKSELPEVPSLALGTGDVSLLEMVHAYNGLLFDTQPNELQLITRIEDARGRLLWHNEGAREQVLSPYTQAVMREVLQSVAKNGTAASLRSRYKLSNAIAGKTGTSQDQSDGWFIGATPQIVAGAWVGAEDRRMHFKTLSQGQGARTALPIWAGFMQRVNADPNYQSWKSEQFPRISTEVARDLNCDPTQFLTRMSDFKAWWEEQKKMAEN